MKSQRFWYVVRRLAVDTVLLSGSFVTANLIHFEGEVPAEQRESLPHMQYIPETKS